MLYKYGKQTRDFGGVFIPCLVYFSIFWGFFNKTIIPFALVGNEIYGPRWLFTISYPTRAHGIIVNYHTEIRSNPAKYQLNTVQSTENLEITT